MARHGDQMVHVGVARGCRVGGRFAVCYDASEFVGMGGAWIIWRVGVRGVDAVRQESALVVVDRCSVVTRDDAICRVRYSKYIIITN